jgi:uncharacterized pyridoxamine 5'-phosphate oxidase family protein
LGYLATIGADNTPRVRPVFVKDVYGDDLYFHTLSTTRKVAEMASNPHVEVVWAEMQAMSQVRIRGTAAVVEDEATKERFLADNPMATQMLPEEARPLVRLYKVHPQTVEWAQGPVPYSQVDW